MLFSKQLLSLGLEELKAELRYNIDKSAATQLTSIA